MILLPIVDRPAATCCKPDVKFVRVRCTLNFGALISLDPYPVTPILRVEYYIELPQALQVVHHGANNIHIETFVGRADLSTYTPAEFQGILEEVQQDAPIKLTKSEFNLQAANTDSINLATEIDRRILKLAWHQICASLFAEICPGYTAQPQAAIDHIKQCYIDGEGNRVCVSVYEYFQRMMNAMRPFAGDKVFPKSVCNALIEGMSPNLLRVFSKHYTDHSLLHDTSSIFSIQPLQAHSCRHDSRRGRNQEHLQDCTSVRWQPSVRSLCPCICKPSQTHPYSLCPRWRILIRGRVLFR
jgi:hypothetical protein